MLIVGSETGMVKFDEADDHRKGPRRSGPDASASISTAAHFYRDDAMKDMLAARQPFGEWAKRITSDRPHRQDRCGRAGANRGRGTAPPPARRRLHAGGAGNDPASDGGGRAGSRRQHGRRHADRRAVRAAIAACTIIFRQKFSQVTNPPIDSLRETARDDAQDAARQSRQRAGRGLRASATCCSWKARCCPPPNSGDARASWAPPPAWWIAPSRSPTARPGCARRIERIRHEAEEGVRAGCTHVILTDEAHGAGACADPDDPGDRRRAHASGAPVAAHLHQPQRALRPNAWTCIISPC